MYQTTFKTAYLKLAKDLTEQVFIDFYDEKSGFFFYTSTQVKLIQRSIETQDNVIPASNSVMAHNLFKLSKFYLKKEWQEVAELMLKKILPQIKDYPSGYSNWLSLQLNFTHQFYELVFSKESASSKAKIQQYYLPQLIYAVTDEEIPLTNGKESENELYYLCKEGACELPQKNIENVIDRLNS